MSLEHAEFTSSNDLSASYDAVMNLDGTNNPAPSVFDQRCQLKQNEDGGTRYVVSSAVPNTILVFSDPSKDQANVTLLGITEDSRGWDVTSKQLYDHKTRPGDRTAASVQALIKVGIWGKQAQSASTAAQLELYKLLSTEEGATRVWNAGPLQEVEEDDILGEMRASVHALVDEDEDEPEPTVRRSATDPR